MISLHTNGFTNTLLDKEDLTKKENISVKNFEKSEIETIYKDKGTAPLRIANNKGDVSISTNQPRLILEETKLAIGKNVDVIKENVDK